MASGNVPEPDHSTSAPVHETRLLEMTNAGLDSLFRASPDGGIPDGDMQGMVLLFPGTRATTPLAAATHAVVWQGKVVNRRWGELKNKITPLGLRQITAQVSVGPSWVDDGPCVVLDYSKTSFVARLIRDELRLVAPDLYLGVVWARRRRVAWFWVRGPAERV